ncbi:MAG: thioredoxin domain-containing protein [Hyphomicrobiales bacterium]|nr:thioredoxin domain-containing protein [Hyphomicrobiales bacterium]MDE2016140.1 thioredoxin domain-containing protein [Hyphomicrobiales bacterium]
MSANELAQAQSPYLRQHRDNPVHWRQWSPAAFAEARARNVPVLLSVGYAACHWCHVMAHESFEDAHTAALMNFNFVSIKVDREERPDVDQLYMKALHLLGQRGGWPLTMFLDADGAPFWGGTYFPPTPRHGMPSFKQVLATISESYRADPNAIATNVSAIMEALTEPKGEGLAWSPSRTDDVARTLLGAMDPVHGGLRGAPKFPNFPILETLWRAGRRTGDAAFAQATLLALRRMCLGGIRDHLGGGFARYSVDERWLAPHFEKMLYDNALLLPWLALAHRETGEALFLEAAEGVVGWLEREMIAPGGAFASSLDADSDGVEGKYYVWTDDELRAELTRAGLGETADDFAAAYGVTSTGNWRDDHGGSSVTILNRLDAPDVDVAGFAAARAALLAHRETRSKPARDDKSLADWNGLAIVGLARAGMTLDRPRWIKLAESAFARSLTLFLAKGYGASGRLGHSWRGDALVQPGFAGDHASMALAAVTLFEATQAPTYLLRARRFLDALDDAYLLPSGLYATTAKDAPALVARLAPTEDDATPNPHALAIEALARLAALTGEVSLRRRLADRIEAAGAAIAAAPTAHCGLLNAIDLAVRLREVAIVGPDAGALVAAARSAPWLDRTFHVVAEPSALGTDHLAAAQARAAGGIATAFVCEASTCGPPIRDAAALSVALARG